MSNIWEEGKAQPQRQNWRDDVLRWCSNMLPSKQGQAQSVTYNATPIVMAAVVYFLILWPVVRLLSRLQNRALHASAR